jgi:hypothetical protein
LFCFLTTHEVGIARDIRGGDRCQSALIPCHPLPFG